MMRSAFAFLCSGFDVELFLRERDGEVKFLRKFFTLVMPEVL